MSGEQRLDAESELNQYLSQIDDFIVSGNFDTSKYQDECEEYLSLDQDDFNRLTQQSLLDGAYYLFGYCAYIQDNCNKQKIILSWCNSQLDKLVIKYEKTNGFEQYTKHEFKRPIVISDNIYAAKVEELRLLAESRFLLLDSKCYNVRRQGETLLEKAKRQ